MPLKKLLLTTFSLLLTSCPLPVGAQPDRCALVIANAHTLPERVQKWLNSTLPLIEALRESNSGKIVEFTSVDGSHRIKIDFSKRITGENQASIVDLGEGKSYEVLLPSLTQRKAREAREWLYSFDPDFASWFLPKTRFTAEDQQKCLSWLIQEYEVMTPISGLDSTASVADELRLLRAHVLGSPSMEAFWRRFQEFTGEEYLLSPQRLQRMEESADLDSKYFGDAVLFLANQLENR